MTFPVASPGTEPVWFGFPFLLDEKLRSQRADYVRYLTSRGVENRPIISGNFTRQPALRLFDISCDPGAFPNAERVNDAGLFIGLHGQRLGDASLEQLADILLGYEFAN